MKISEILVEQELDEISRRGFLKGAVGAAATGLGMSSAKDSKAQSMDSPPENMIVNDIITIVIRHYTFRHLYRLHARS